MVIYSAWMYACVYVCEQRERGRETRAAQRGSGLPCSSTSGLYIRPLINPEWRPGSDSLTGQAPVQDRAWFITTELQLALIYFGLRRGENRGGVFSGIRGVYTDTALFVWKGRDTGVESDWEGWVTEWQATSENWGGGAGFVMFYLKGRLFSFRWVMFPPSHVLSVRATSLALSHHTGRL